MVTEGKEISKKRKIITGKISYIVLLLLTLIVIFFVFGIVIYLIVKGSSAINWEFLSQKPGKGMREGGIFP
ncbi:MAG: phosphate ABC transporter, permease protein PstA, partial [Actinomycetota bacterium]|nr:phosphate ABC transporter, permease protein PstA [Actinomycetota bacterium]